MKGYLRMKFQKKEKLEEVNKGKEITNAPAENKMGVMPVNKLLVSMAVPMMISMLVQALYNVVDSIFVSRIHTSEKVYNSAGHLVSAGTDAISALGLAFPVQILIIAFGVGTSVGVNAVLSRALGEKKQKTADSAAIHGLFLVICSYVLFLIIGLVFAGMIIKAQGATGRTFEYGNTYLSIICCCSIAAYMEMMLERLLQSTGRTIYSMITQSVGAIINVICDPILIFGLFGMPKMGVAGAAIATVFGQLVAAILALYFNIKKNPDINLKFRGFKPELKMIGKIYSVGLPAIIMQAVGSVMNFGMNSIIIDLNTSAVAVFTVYYKLQSFFFMPLFGMSNAMIPIVAYNFGARKRKRMMKTYKLSLLYAFCLIAVGFILFEAIPDRLLLLFDTGDASLLAIGVPALRKIGVHYLLAWFAIVTGSLFQALGNGVYSLVVSVSRQLVVLLPAAYLLGKAGGIDMIWWAFPIAELMSMLVTMLFYIHSKKNIIDKIQ